MSKTVVGLLENPNEAEIVVQELIDGGFDRSDISLIARDEYATRGEAESGGETGSGAMTGAGIGAAFGGVGGLLVGLAGLAIPGIGPIIAAGPLATALAGAGVGAVAGGLIGSLTGMGVPEEEAEYYAEGVRRGGVLVAVKADDDNADIAANTLRGHSAVDIEEHAGFDETATPYSEDERQGVIPVVDEELQVGKRTVGRGTARIYSHTTETPVEETVRLREEHANVERRPVDRPLGEAEDAFQDRAIGISETAEEPVASKRTRVTEEVRADTEASEHDETIRDKLRHTKVDVEKAGREESEKLGLGGKSNRGRYTGVERRRGSSAMYRGEERRVS